LPSGPHGDDWHGSDVMETLSTRSESNFTYSSLLCTKFHSIPANNDRETHSLSQYRYHCSNRDSMHIRRALITQVLILLPDNRHRTTLVTGRSDKARITFTSKRIRSIRNASAMLITDIRRADYTDDRNSTRRASTSHTLSRGQMVKDR
jgi:hypothetical protein